MTTRDIYQQGWTLDDITWDRFEPSKVDPELLAAVKAAAMVEHNAMDYVVYLKRVFQGCDQQMLDAIDHWGVEEVQHGQALARWCELADPQFDFENAFARFRAGYQPPHFASGAGSVRGSRRGEMIARCVVEAGTSSYYTAIKDAALEPVLQQVAGRIAADEFRHYKLFYEVLHNQDEPELPFFKRLWVAVTRVNESDDDELAYAYYAANIHPSIPYDRASCARASAAKAMRVYQPSHIRKLVQMIAKAIGAAPQGLMARIASGLVWRMLRLRAGMLARA